MLTNNEMCWSFVSILKYFFQYVRIQIRPHFYFLAPNLSAIFLFTIVFVDPESSIVLILHCLVCICIVYNKRYYSPRKFRNYCFEGLKTIFLSTSCFWNNCRHTFSIFITLYLYSNTVVVTFDV